MTAMSRLEKTYVCTYGNCNKDFRRKSDLARHRNIHANIRPYKCKVCGKKFGQSAGLKTHMNTHTHQRPHKCKYCDSGFADPSSCKRHEHETHEGFLGYRCPRCNSTLKRRAYFVKHLKKRYNIDAATMDLRSYKVWRIKSETSPSPSPAPSPAPLESSALHSGRVTRSQGKRARAVYTSDDGDEYEPAAKVARISKTRSSKRSAARVSRGPSQDPSTDPFDGLLSIHSEDTLTISSCADEVYPQLPASFNEQPPAIMSQHYGKYEVDASSYMPFPQEPMDFSMTAGFEFGFDGVPTWNFDFTDDFVDPYLSAKAGTSYYSPFEYGTIDPLALLPGHVGTNLAVPTQVTASPSMYSESSALSSTSSPTPSPSPSPPNGDPSPAVWTVKDNFGLVQGPSVLSPDQVHAWVAPRSLQDTPTYDNVFDPNFFLPYKYIPI